MKASVLFIAIALFFQIPSGDGKHALKLTRGNHRAKRNLENGELKFEEVPLVPGYGTHIAYLYIGTPPQRQSVIIDTGSHLTAIPCTGCSNCGTHTDSYWKIESSSTANISGCKNCLNNFQCLSNEDKCYISQSYSEGSSWSAYQVTDKLFTGSLSIADTSSEDFDFSLEFMFGCIVKQTKLFVTQLADGIMGMSQMETTLVQQLYSKNILKEASFSLCFDKDGGTMVLGGSEPLLWEKDMVFTTSLHSTGWFTVELLDIRVGEDSIGVKSNIFQKGRGIIVDSGTTETYLARSIAPNFNKVWEKITGLNYNPDTLVVKADDVPNLPTITFVFGGNKEVQMKPETYMTTTGSKYDYYSPGIFFEESSGGILGANFMRNHDVLFDQTNMRIGFAPAQCMFEDLQAKKNATVTTPMPTNSYHTFSPTITSTVNCEIEDEMEIIGTCNATCPSNTKTSAEKAKGVEIWSQQYVTAQTDTSNCQQLQKEFRPCSIECDSDENDYSGCTTAWSSCDVYCKQYRRSSSKINETVCEDEERMCHIGSICPGAFIGLIVTCSIEVYFSMYTAWESIMNDIVAEKISRSFLNFGQNVPPGDVHIYPVTEMRTGKKRHLGSTSSEKRDLSSSSFRVPFGIHVYPEEENARAYSIEALLKSEQYTVSLKKSLAENLDFDEVSFVSSDIAILYAADKSVYRGPNYQPGSPHGQDRLGENGPILVLLFVILIVGLALMVLLRRKANKPMLPVTRLKGANKYRVVEDNGSDINNPDEFEMTRTNGFQEGSDPALERAPVL